MIVSQRTASVQNADRILVMKEGSLIGQGTHDELLKSCAEYKEMVDANDRRDKWNIKKLEVGA